MGPEALLRTHGHKAYARRYSNGAQAHPSGRAVRLSGGRGVCVGSPPRDPFGSLTREPAPPRS